MLNSILISTEGQLTPLLPESWRAGRMKSLKPPLQLESSLPSGGESESSCGPVY